MYVSNSWSHFQINEFKLATITSDVENIWSEFSQKFDKVLSTIASKNVPCLIAGDFNIDLTKFNCNDNTGKYTDMLLLNNFLPSILLPTRVTPKSATLIDHIYYNLCSKINIDAKIISGNFLQDLSDHLPNYFILYNEKTKDQKQRPLVRIFSENNYSNFAKFLQEADWEPVHLNSDVNVAYNNFADIL